MDEPNAQIESVRAITTNRAIYNISVLVLILGFVGTLFILYYAGLANNPFPSQGFAENGYNMMVALYGALLMVASYVTSVILEGLSDIILLLKVSALRGAEDRDGN